MNTVRPFARDKITNEFTAFPDFAREYFCGYRVSNGSRIIQRKEINRIGSRDCLCVMCYCYDCAILVFTPDIFVIPEKILNIYCGMRI